MVQFVYCPLNVYLSFGFTSHKILSVMRFICILLINMNVYDIQGKYNSKQSLDLLVLNHTVSDLLRSVVNERNAFKKTNEFTTFLILRMCEKIHSCRIIAVPRYICAIKYNYLTLHNTAYNSTIYIEHISSSEDGNIE